jgi:2-polyprenyl-3-methyl-5-hydroxy-6-metoxy-1,4-benzoquinol methylase
MPTLFTPTVERYEQYASHYARSGNQAPDWRAADAHPERFARRAEWLPEDKNARILDVGCGWGSLLLSLSCAGYRRLEGVDLSPEQTAIGNHAAEGRVLIHCADGREFLSRHRSEFDLITLISVIEHIPTSEVVPFLNQVRLALAPGGRVVLFAPNMANLTSAWIQFSDITHATGFTELSIQQALDQAGFVDHHLVRSNARDLSRWQISRPWRGLGLGQLANEALHRAIYHITGQSPRPTCFAANLEVYSHRPAAGKLASRSPRA